MKIGFIGLGNQGLPMAQMIERGGWPLTVWARRREAAAEAFAGTSAQIAGSPLELARACDAVGVCVPADADVLEVVLGENGLADGLCAGSVLMIHSTVLPQTCLELARALEDRGVGVLDMPVSGSGRYAFAKTLTVMAGGERTLFDRVSPVCESYGEAIYLGPLGSGQRLKLVNNTLFMANLALALDAIELARALDLDHRAAETVIGRSSGASYALEAAARFRDEYPDLDRPRRTLRKDLSHYDDMISALRVGGRLSDLGIVALDHLARLDAAKART